ncbi:Spy/CpxP family protein refolding chaperone [Herminiimonas arsenitoxidans]|uniref:Spy/CpxP family protein refolding chaperone n=1 Tax=Herminiimonas arsenitoxidans TaxID=1809410 RepID=UPI000970E30F|nr:Spy/CpxP family protein refolding chaperone [Herminiimonas arsenitoxidans]
MNKQTPLNKMTIASVQTASRGRRLMMVGATAAIVSVLSFAGVSYAQEGQAPQTTTQQKHFDHRDKMNPEHAGKRFDRMLSRLVPDATPEQKTKLDAIAKAAFTDLRPLHEQSRAAHAQGLKLLAQSTIDRKAIEQVRQTEQKLADQRSRRMSQAFADAAEVLTPAQRVKAVEQLSKHGPGFGHRFGHGPRHGHGPDRGPGAAPQAPAPAAQ